MELADIFRHADQEPFEAFIVELESGRTVCVHHPEDIHFAPHRAKVRRIQAYDRIRDIEVFFGPTAVTAIVKVGEDGDDASGGGPSS